MKKILLTSTAIAAFSGAALAEGPAVTVGGKVVTQYGIVSQANGITNASNARASDSSDQHMRTDSRVDLKVSGKADNGLSYGGVTSIIGNASGQDDSGNDNVASEKTFVFVESGLGKVEAGGNSGAAQTMKVGAQSFARGSGGIAGDFYKFVNLGAVNQGGSLVRSSYIVTPDLPSVATPGARNRVATNAGATPTDPNVTEYANKITYYSPKVLGAQVGVSYIPNTNEKGNANGFSGKFAGANAPQGYKDTLSGGVTYSTEISGVGVKASAVAEKSAKTQKASFADAASYGDMKAYEGGVVVTYSGASVGGSYATVEDYGTNSANKTEGNFWTAGAGYEFGPFAASVTYLESQARDKTIKNDFKNVSVGADYKLAPGLVPYVEVSFFEASDSLASTQTNDGNVILLGTQLTF
jgi:predicted porin